LPGILIDEEENTYDDEEVEEIAPASGQTLPQYLFKEPIDRSTISNAQTWS